MPRISYPGGFGLALAQGLPAFTENYGRGEDERRRRELQQQALALQGRGVALQEAAGRRAEEDFTQRRALQQALPEAIARFGGALTQSLQTPTVIPDPDAASVGMEGGVPAPAVIRRPPSTFAALQTPEAGTLVQAGVNPLPMIQSAEEFRRRDEERTNREEALGRLPEIVTMMKSDPIGGTLAGVQAFARAGLIKSVDLGGFAELVAKDPEVARGEFERLGPIFERIATNTVDVTDWAKTVTELSSFRSPAGRFFAQSLIPILSSAALDPGRRFVRSYADVLQTAPKPDDPKTRREIFNALQAQNPEGAVKAIAGGLLPDIAQQIRLERKRAEAEAGETPAQEELRKAQAERARAQAGKPTTAAAKDAALDQLETYASGQGEDLAVEQINALRKRAGLKELKSIDLEMIQFQQRRQRAKGGSGQAAKAPTAKAAAGAGGGGNAQALKAQIDAAVTRLFPGTRWLDLTAEQKEQVRQSLGGP